MNGPTRRQTLGGLLGGLGLATMAGCSRGGGGQNSTPGNTNIRLTWWGNDLRAEQTSEAVDLYLSQNDGINVEELPSEFGAYWDRLATQTAGNDMPDMIQMADGFIAEYGTRGALLDLEPYIDVSRFAEGTVDVGRIDGKLMGINAGINTPVLMCNLNVLEAAGVDRPDDTTWTWDDYLQISTEITQATPDGTFGTTSPGAEGVLRAWLRQNGEELFTTEGQFGATDQNLRGYFELLTNFFNDNAIPSASVIVEDGTKPLEQAPLVVGTAAFSLWWSNQYAALSNVSADEIVLLRMPTLTGRADDLQAWYHPSMLWCASARTANPEAVAALIDWWVNSTDCAEICLDERGRPANAQVLEQIESRLSDAGQDVSQFLTSLEPYLGDPQPVPPPGSGQVLDDILTRVQTDMFFGRIDATEATTQFISESTDAIGG